MTVYVTQEVSTVDYAPASAWGDIVFLSDMKDRISKNKASSNNEYIIDGIRAKLEKFTEHDYLVCSGSPVLMVIIGNILGDKLKNILIWENREMKYYNVQINK